MLASRGILLVKAAQGVGWEGVLPENGGQRADRSVAPMMHATQRAMPAPGCGRPEQAARQVVPLRAAAAGPVRQPAHIEELARAAVTFLATAATVTAMTRLRPAWTNFGHRGKRPTRSRWVDPPARRRRLRGRRARACRSARRPVRTPGHLVMAPGGATADPNEGSWRTFWPAMIPWPPCWLAGAGALRGFVGQPAGGLLRVFFFFFFFFFDPSLASPAETSTAKTAEAPMSARLASSAEGAIYHNDTADAVVLGSSRLGHYCSERYTNPRPRALTTQTGRS